MFNLSLPSNGHHAEVWFEYPTPFLTHEAVGFSRKKGVLESDILHTVVRAVIRVAPPPDGVVRTPWARFIEWVRNHPSTTTVVGTSTCNSPDTFNARVGRAKALTSALKSFPREDRVAVWGEYLSTCRPQLQNGQDYWIRFSPTSSWLIARYISAKASPSQTPMFIPSDWRVGPGVAASSCIIGGKVLLPKKDLTGMFRAR